MKTCKEPLWASRIGYHGTCTRNAGYGSDKAYCKQHARKHDNKKAELVLWMRSRYTQTPQEIKVREFNDKTYVDKNGMRHPMRSNYSIMYQSFEEAMGAIISSAEGHIASLQSRLADAKKELAECRKILKKYKERG